FAGVNNVVPALVGSVQFLVLPLAASVTAVPFLVGFASVDYCVFDFEFHGLVFGLVGGVHGSAHGSGCYWLLGVVGSHLLCPSNRYQSWLFADGQHADLPSITLANINRRLIASDEHGTSLALKSTPPFSDGPNRIVDCIQSIGRAAKGGNRGLLKRVCIPFFDGLPTEKHPVRSQQNRVLCEKRSQGSSIVVLVCLLLLHPEHAELTKGLGNPDEITLLDYSCIASILLLSEGRQSKADCNSC